MATTVLPGVPSDYGELAARYLADIRAVVRKRIPWAQPADVDDIVQYIVQQFQKTDVLGQYDPDKASTLARDPFRALILAKAALYCKGKAERLAVTGARELLIADAPVGDGSSTWMETVADAPVSLGGLADGEALERMRAHLASRPALPGQPGLLALFDELSDRVAAGKPVTDAAMAKRYRTGPETAASWLAMLRDELRTAVAGDFRAARSGAREIGGLWLSDDQIREAARLLRDAPGNQVVKVWARGGHPLAGAGKTWYLKPANAELDAYPHLRGVKGGHYEGGHGSPVRRALIHWLERLTGDLDETIPPSPEWAAVQLALSRLPGSDEAKVADALAMLELVFGEKP